MSLSRFLLFHTGFLLCQAAYAYSVISGQAANVVGAMDKMWAGSPDGNGQQHLEGPEADSSILGTSAVQQQARVAMALGSNEDREDVYIQVWWVVDVPQYANLLMWQQQQQQRILGEGVAKGGTLLCLNEMRRITVNTVFMWWCCCLSYINFQR